ncbi:hypothetical protein CIB48_g11162 [Xylaria polymorpha]|nr:hypothetical protein CIB48_g11162 [Xylaria polymorpha]
MGGSRRVPPRPQQRLCGPASDLLPPATTISIHPVGRPLSCTSARNRYLQETSRSRFGKACPEPRHRVDLGYYSAEASPTSDDIVS